MQTDASSVVVQIREVALISLFSGEITVKLWCAACQPKIKLVEDADSMIRVPRGVPMCNMLVDLRIASIIALYCTVRADAFVFRYVF